MRWLYRRLNRQAALGLFAAARRVAIVRHWAGKATAVGIISGILAALFIGNVRAHDNPTNWIGQERRTNAAGVLCCGESDCHAFTTDQVKVMPDGYHFPDGEVVPFEKAAPSVDRFFWKCTWGGETKCVFAPMGAS